MSKKVFFCVSFEDNAEAVKIASKVHELADQGINNLKTEPPKLIIKGRNFEEESYIVCPSVFLVENEKDIGGKLVLEGKIMGQGRNFSITIS